MCTTHNRARGVLFSSIFSIFFVSASVSRADSIEKSGDALLILMPTFSYLYSYYQSDREGQIELSKALLSTVAVTYALKFATKEERPNRKNNRSFPSGHSAVTFTSAGYLHKRYGLDVAILPYVGAGWTAYSRVKSKNHYTKDVLAGALIGLASSYLWTKAIDTRTIYPISDGKRWGIGFLKKW